MRITPGVCPECGGRAVAVLEHVLIWSPLQQDDEDNEPEQACIITEGMSQEQIDDCTLHEHEEPEAGQDFEYEDDHQEVIWDTQEGYCFDNGCTQLKCSQDHVWNAVHGEDPGEGLPVPGSRDALVDACEEIIACDLPPEVLCQPILPARWYERFRLAVDAARQALGKEDDDAQSTHS